MLGMKDAMLTVSIKRRKTDRKKACRLMPFYINRRLFSDAVIESLHSSIHSAVYHPLYI